jgi:hypothetical protein
MECPGYLKPFVSASTELARLVAAVMYRHVPVSGFSQERSGMTDNIHSDAVSSRQLHAVLSQQGGCHDYSGLAVGAASVGLDPEEVWRQAHAALLSPTTVAVTCARHLQNCLRDFGSNSPPEGVVLVTAQGIEPKIAGTITAFMLLPAAFAAQAAPLLAHIFARLAALPDLSLSYGRLVSTPETGEIRLLPVVVNESQKVGAGRETASTLQL